MKRLNAFTLIELLIASAIFVVVMVTVYSAFHTGIFGYRKIEEATEMSQTARLILERLNLDLRNCFAYSDDQTKFSGSANEISFLTLVDTFSKDRVLAEYAFVSYKWEEEKLMRLCRKNKDSLKESEEIQPEAMASNIELNLEYGQILSGQQEIVFKESWAGPNDSAEEQKALPLAVKVKLTLKDKTKQDFERTIFLPR